MGSSGQVLDAEALHQAPIYELNEAASAMSADKFGNLYISLDSGKVLIINNQGHRREIIGFTRPQGLAVSNNILVVADIGDRQLIALDLTSETQTVIAEHLPIGSPTDFEPMGYRVSVSTDGNSGFYVGCNGNGSLIHITQM